MAISLVTVFWGEWHTKAFLNYCLPSLLSRYNLPALPSGGRALIATNKGNIENILAHKRISELSKLMPVSFLPIPDDRLPQRSNVDSGKSMGAFLVDQQRRLVKAGFEGGFDLSYIHADCIYANPTFETVGRLSETADIVYLPAFRVAIEDFSEATGGSLEPSSRRADDLIPLSLSCLHDHHRHQFWDAPRPTRGPSMRLWKVSKSLILAREFNEKTPLFISNRLSDVPFNNGTDHFDSEIFDASVKRRGSARFVHYIQDSRDGFVGSFAPKVSEPHGLWMLYGSLDPNGGPPPPPPTRSASYLAGFKMYFNDAMRKFSASHLIQLHISQDSKLPAYLKMFHLVHFWVYRLWAMVHG